MFILASDIRKQFWSSLTQAVDDEDYARAVEEVRSMGLDPAAIPHYKPAN